MPACELGLGYLERQHCSFSGLREYQFKEEEGRCPVSDLRHCKCCDLGSNEGKGGDKYKYTISFAGEVK